MMSVLIKGMEMPKNCGECLLAKLSPTGESLICNYMLSRVSWEERPFDCPLVTVPDHGRLIDADELKTAFPCCTSVKTGCVRATINNAPTIIPAEESET